MEESLARAARRDGAWAVGQINDGVTDQVRCEGGVFVSIIRVGLAESKKFADGYDAIFNKKKKAEPAKKAVDAPKVAAAAKVTTAKKAVKAVKAVAVKAPKAVVAKAGAAKKAAPAKKAVAKKA
jgi:hypothetical protein